MDRAELIRQIYYQELGRLRPDEAGAKYWAGRNDLNESQLRNAIRGSGLGANAGRSVVEPLLADSQFAAYLRGAQFNESQIQSSLQAAQEAAARRILGQRPMYAEQIKQGGQNINSSYEARQNRTGVRLKDLNDQRNAVERSRLQFETGVNENKAEMERKAAQDIAAIRRQGAEEQLAARDRLTLRSAGM